MCWNILGGHLVSGGGDYYNIHLRMTWMRWMTQFSLTLHPSKSPRAATQFRHRTTGTLMELPVAPMNVAAA